jgi:hypothetical protein
LFEGIRRRLRDDNVSVRGKAEMLLGELRDSLLLGLRARDFSVLSLFR